MKRIPEIWNEFLSSQSFLLREIQGKRDERTPPYKRNYKKKGVYVLRRGNQVVYVGVSGGSGKREPIEGILADRLWSHKYPSEDIHKKLTGHGIDVLDCKVLTYFEEDPQIRAQIKSDLIDYFNPIGNG
jgi:hypothetical protein